jgi:glycosyltransferase involved in cell wall biosynthesis
VRRLGDFSQIEAFQVAPEAEVLYGNIVFPVAVGRRLPVVWSTQGVIDARPGIWFPEESARTHSILISRSAVTQCWSQVGFGGLLARRPQIPADRVKVIPPLIYIDLPPPVEPPDGDLRALFVGWDARLKGLPVVLDALSAVGPGVRLEVITAGAAPEGLPSHVDWLGPQPRQEVLRRLRRADIHVFPSRTESFGVAALEAMAAGVAQVVDSNGVPAEVAGGGALTVDGSDASDLRRAVERLAGDRELRAALGREGLRRWQTRYCPEVVGPQLEAALAAAASAGLQP